VGVLTPSQFLVQRRPEDSLIPRPSADGATLVSMFVALQLIIPAKLVISKLPLSLSPANVVALVIGLCWLCAQFTNTLGVAKGRNPVRTMLFLYACSLLATYGFATYAYLPPDELNLADHGMVLALASVGLALGVCDGVRGHDRLDLVLKTITVAGAVVAVVGILQFLLDLDLTKYLRLPGLRYTAEDGFLFERSSLRRVAATTGHPIEFGVVCAMLLPLAVHLATKAGGRAQPWLRWWLCAGLIAAGLMFSISRSPILSATGAGLVLFLGWSARRRVQAVLALVGFLALTKVIAPGLLGAFYNMFANVGTDDSIRYRTHDYAAASAEIAKHLWLGRGLGTWYAPKHQIFDNQYLLSLVEVGALGLVTFIGIFLAGIYAALRARMMSSDPGDRDLGLTLAAMLVAPIVACATFDFASFATGKALAFLIAGAAASLLRTARSSPAAKDLAIHHARSDLIADDNGPPGNTAPAPSESDGETSSAAIRPAVPAP
jgi:O-antigen ligase